MRDLIKNKRTIYYLNYVKTEDVVDDNGNLTGEKKVIYTPRKQLKTNISGARGNSQAEVFGTDVKYDKTFVLTASEFEKTKITENSVFFVDINPTYEGTNPLYDYRVEKIADTINDVVVAITKVRR